MLHFQVNNICGTFVRDFISWFKTSSVSYTSDPWYVFMDGRSESDGTTAWNPLSQTVMMTPDFSAQLQRMLCRTNNHRATC